MLEIAIGVKVLLMLILDSLLVKIMNYLNNKDLLSLIRNKENLENLKILLMGIYLINLIFDY